MQYDAIAHISVSQLQPGDLVFFYTPIEHVGIYVGGGQMIDAPYTGAVVRYDSIYRDSLVGAGRPDPPENRTCGSPRMRLTPFEVAQPSIHSQIL